MTTAPTTTAPGRPPVVDMATWQAAKTAETARLEGVYRAMLTEGNVELVAGHARFVDAHTIAVNGQRLSARPGSRGPGIGPASPAEP